MINLSGIPVLKLSQFAFIAFIKYFTSFYPNIAIIQQQQVELAAIELPKLFIGTKNDPLIIED
jgi:hypothetical protein